MTPDLRALITQMAAKLDHCEQLLLDDRRQRHPLADRARTLLAKADGPAVPVLPDDALIIEPAEYTLLVPVAQPVPLSERLPEPNVKVLAHYFNALGNGRTICAIWVPAKSRSDEGDLDADDFLEYDEESDKYHWPEGWYEAIENWDELGWAKVYEGEIVYWQPLPKWPANAHALPTPEATND